MGFGLPLTILSRNTLTPDCYNLRIITVISDQSYWDTSITLHPEDSCFTLPSAPSRERGSFTEIQTYSSWLDGGIPLSEKCNSISPSFLHIKILPLLLTDSSDWN